MGRIDTYPSGNSVIPTMGSTLAYAQVTSNQTLTAAADLIGLSVTITVPDGRRIRISGKVAFDNDNAGNNYGTVAIREAGVDLNSSYSGLLGNGNLGEEDTVFVEHILTPTAGTHTYYLQARGTVYNLVSSASSTRPSFILVEDITGSQVAPSPQNVPLGMLAYTQITDTVAISDLQDVPGLSLNITVPAGRTIKITFHGQIHTSAASGWLAALKQDGTIVGRLWTVSTDGAEYQMVNGEAILSPSAGAHVYTVNMDLFSGSGTCDFNGAIPAYPIWMSAEDITSTPAQGLGAPGSTLAYALQTVNSAAFSAETDVPNCSVNVTVPAGRRLKITGHLSLSSPTVANDEWVIWIVEDGVHIKHDVKRATNIGDAMVLESAAITTPSAGTHTYKITGQRTTGTGTAVMNSASDRAGFIIVEDVTGAVWPQGSQVTAGIIAPEAWTTYTPSHTGITVGNGTETAAYIQLGKTVHVRWTLILGTTSSIGADPRVGLPVTAKVASGLRHVGMMNLLDAGVRNYIGQSLIHESDATHAFIIHTESGNAGTVNTTNPFTWGSTDTMVMSMTYEAA